VRAGEAFGLRTFAAGDAEEIAEASAAIFSGRIKGLEIARDLGATDDPVPEDWRKTSAILKSKPGKTVDRQLASSGGVFPVFHCEQEIPCNPCTSVCPRGLIRIDEDDIRRIPKFIADELGAACVGCERCVTICPGLAITLVDRREDPERPIVTIPFEFEPDRVAVGDEVVVLDTAGGSLGSVPVTEVKTIPSNDRTVLVKVRATAEIAHRIAGIRVQEPWIGDPLPEAVEPLADTDIVCRCERVTAGEIRDLIRSGVWDVNEIKAVSRAGMGACGGKTCQALIQRLFREEGVPLADVTENVPRPLFVEVPFGVFAGADSSERPLSSSRSGNPVDSLGREGHRE